MIPKKIHLIWLSGEDYPKEVDACIDSWRRILPDYEICHWGMEEAEMIDSVFLHEAIGARKWAFAADFLRLYAVYHQGGIYLDSDVEVMKGFESLPGDKAFIGREHSVHIDGGQTECYLGAHCFGAEAGNAFVGRCLDYYTGRHFITSEDESLPMGLKYDMKILPYIMSEIAKESGYDSSALADREQDCGEVMIYRSDCFDPQEGSEDSYCRHLALGSWRDKARYEPEYTLRYKLEWRMVALMEKLLKKMDYMTVKLR